ncbi:MAG: flagellar motor switch protein FliN [Thermaerobacter sp.]
MNESEGDLLTQEEIDALLAELEAGDEGGDLEPAEEAAFARLLGAVAGAAAPALGLQAPDTGASDADVEVVPVEEAHEALSGGALVIDVSGPVQATVAVGPGGVPSQAPDEPAVQAAAAEIRRALEEAAVGGVDLQAQWQDQPDLGKGSAQDPAVVARWGVQGPVAAALLREVRSLVEQSAQARQQAAEVPLAAAAAPAAAAAAAVQSAGRQAEPAEYPELDPAGDQAARAAIELLYDVPLEVTAVLGRTRRQIGEVLNLGPGSVLELDKLAGEPVDLLVNGKLIARGEVVVIDEHFGVRITDIVSRAERLKRMR